MLSKNLSYHEILGLRMTNCHKNWCNFIAEMGMSGDLLFAEAALDNVVLIAENKPSSLLGKWEGGGKHQFPLPNVGCRRREGEWEGGKVITLASLRTGLLASA